MPNNNNNKKDKKKKEDGDGDGGKTSAPPAVLEPAAMVEAVRIRAVDCLQLAGKVHPSVTGTAPLVGLIFGGGDVPAALVDDVKGGRTLLRKKARRPGVVGKLGEDLGKDVAFLRESLTASLERGGNDGRLVLVQVDGAESYLRGGPKPSPRAGALFGVLLWQKQRMFLRSSAIDGQDLDHEPMDAELEAALFDFLTPDGLAKAKEEEEKEKKEEEKEEKEEKEEDAVLPAWTPRETAAWTRLLGKLSNNYGDFGKVDWAKAREQGAVNGEGEPVVPQHLPRLVVTSVDWRLQDVNKRYRDLLGGLIMQ